MLMCEKNYEKPKLNLRRVFWGRRDSFFTFYLDDYSDGTYGYSRLYFGTCAGMAAAAGRIKLFEIHVLYNGETIPYSVNADYAFLRINSLYGEIDFCIAEENMLRIRGNSVSLMLTAEPIGHESAKPWDEKSFETDFGILGEKYLFVPIKGVIDTNAPYNYKSFGVQSVKITAKATSNDRIFEIAVQRFLTNDVPRKTFESFETIPKKIYENFNAWQKKLPIVPEKYQEMKEQSGYMIWSNVMHPRGSNGPQMVYVDRSHSAAAYAWQQSFQAMVHGRDIQTAWGFLMSMFHFQDEAGQIPDYTNDYMSAYQSCKPPIQGFAINWLMNNCDMSNITKEQYEQLYEPLKKWTNWWFQFRDRNHDGLPAYDHGDESGGDDNTLFKKGIPLSSPDLAAFLILQMEVLGRIANMLGKKEEEYWYNRSSLLMDKMIQQYWNGKQFIARQGINMENVVESNAIQSYFPLILGKRLPKEIMDTMIEELKRKKFITSYGIASEALDSPHLEFSYAWSRGTINAPNQLIMTIALADCGQKELAEKLAQSYCKTVNKHGPNQHFNPFTGKPIDPFGFFQFQNQVWTSWAACVFLLLAGYYLPNERDN